MLYFSSVEMVYDGMNYDIGFGKRIYMDECINSNFYYFKRWKIEMYKQRIVWFMFENSLIVYDDFYVMLSVDYQGYVLNGSILYFSYDKNELFCKFKLIGVLIMVMGYEMLMEGMYQFSDDEYCERSYSISYI